MAKKKSEAKAEQIKPEQIIVHTPAVVRFPEDVPAPMPEAESHPVIDTISIEGIGPIRKLDIPIPKSGIVVLKGNNGSGKTTATEVVSALITGENVGDLSLAEGELRGTAQGLGIKIVVSRNRNQRTGELETAMKLESRMNLAKFIDPGLKTPQAADQRRLQELAAISGAKPEKRLFRSIFKNPDDFADVFDSVRGEFSDVVELGKEIKNQLHKAARIEETKKELESDRANAKTAAADNVDLTAECDLSKVHSIVAAKQRIFDTAKSERDKGLVRERRLSNAKARLNQLDSTEPADIPAMEVQLSRALESKRTAEEHVRMCEENLMMAKGMAMDAAGLVREIQTNLEGAKRIEKERGTTRELMETIEDGPYPTEEEVRQAEKGWRESFALVEKAKAVNDAIKNLELADQHRALMMAHAERAAVLRNATATVDIVIAESIKAKGLIVEDGRILTKNNRGRREYFHDLSAGEQTSIALGIATGVVGENGLLTLDQSFWEGLDGNARIKVNEEAHRLGVVIMTAEASSSPGDNPLGVEIFDGGNLFQSQPNTKAIKG